LLAEEVDFGKRPSALCRSTILAIIGIVYGNVYSRQAFEELIRLGHVVNDEPVVAQQAFGENLGRKEK
jgi:hypothetical protein